MEDVEHFSLCIQQRENLRQIFAMKHQDLNLEAC
jgi:hypothetical protein